MTFKIAVTGTHSTGKTTFVTALQDRLHSEGFTVAVVSDLGEQCASLGFRILYDHTPQSTLWIISRGISLELEAALNAEVVLVDRPVPDALGYYRAALAYRDEAGPESWANYLSALAGHHVRTYNMIFNTRLDPTIPLGTNKPRDPDSRYRALADTAVGTVLTDLGIEAHPLTPDNHAEAVALVVDCLRSRAAVIPAQPLPADHNAVTVSE